MSTNIHELAGKAFEAVDTTKVMQGNAPFWRLDAEPLMEDIIAQKQTKLVIIKDVGYRSFEAVGDAYKNVPNIQNRRISVFKGDSIDAGAYKIFGATCTGDWQPTDDKGNPNGDPFVKGETRKYFLKAVS